MRRLIFFIIFCIFSLFTIHHPPFTRQAIAAGEFSISYDNIYEVSPNFNLNVTQNVKITNLTTQFYAAELSISIGNVRIEQVVAFDESGPIPTEASFSDNQTTIKLKLNNPIVGRGRVKNFTLSYSTEELVNKAGQILEVAIPKLADPKDIDQFNVTLTVPSGVGPTAFISPEPKASEISGFGGKNKYFFDKSQLLQSGISAAFGEKQVFSFTLTYHLFSPKNSKTEIAIPPDNPYQKVIISQITPAPLNVREDSDGNWMALYKLDSRKQVDVIVQGFVEVYPKPKFTATPKNNLENYLQPQEYWEVNDEYFADKAQALKTPKQIYDFVTSFLSYNQEKLNAPTVARIGAAGAVQNPKEAVCMEFTDLFITLARAAGIGAREINGFAVSSNERLRPLSLRNLGGDTLHAWPEYWDEEKKTWIQVDPTWSSTSGGLDYFSKMDFAHIAFVHKGLSSTYPVPAGGYKIDLGQSGDVEVEFAKNLPQPTFEPKLSIEMSKNLLSGFSDKGKVIIKNLSNQAIQQDPLKITTTDLILKSPAEIDVGKLPPGAFREIEFEVDSEGLLTNKQGKVEVFFEPLTASAIVNVRPSLFLILLIILVGGVVLVGGTIFSVFLFKKFVPKPSF